MVKVLTKILSLISDAKKPQQSAGFTLLELSLVMLLMVILLGFSLPRFSILLDSRLQREAQKIVRIVGNLRLAAILKGENYMITIDTKKSEYSVLIEDPENPGHYSPHQQYTKPIPLEKPVEFGKVTRDTVADGETKFSFQKIEFDKIFGQIYQFRIDSSGFVDLFTVKLQDKENYLTLSVVNIMGKLAISEETPL